MTTDTENITELRAAADEVQAARIEAITEIARLTRELREMTAELDAARADAEWLMDICKLALTYLEDGAHRTAEDRLRAALAAHRAAPPTQSNVLLQAACRELISYRNHNSLNFQLEKADDFINLIRSALEDMP